MSFCTNKYLNTSIGVWMCCWASVTAEVPGFTGANSQDAPWSLGLGIEVERPPLWSSGQSSWLQIRRPGFDSRHYQKKKVVGLERDPLSLVSTTEELLDKSSGSCLENREYCRRDPSRWPRGTLYLQKLAITSPSSGGCSVGIVRSRTQTMEVSLVSTDCSEYSSGDPKLLSQSCSRHIHSAGWWLTWIHQEYWSSNNVH
jgi:hypothetical protein